MPDLVPLEPRGEVEVSLGQQTFILKPSFRAYAAISQRMGGVFPAWQRMEKGDIEAIATVLWAGATLGGNEEGPSVEDFGQLLVENGFDHVTLQLILFVGRPIRGLANASNGRAIEDDGKEEPEGDSKSASD